MQNRQLEKLCLLARRAVAQTGTFIRQQAGKVGAEAIETKSHNSLVSYVDKTAEAQLVEKLGQLLPEAVFITEEDTVENQDGTYQWIIDPLDGTTNFLHQLPFYSISVALREKGETILGIVYEVTREECFYAWKDGGAYLNDERISTTSCATFGDSLIATGFPYYDYEKVTPYLEVFKTLMHGTRGIRRFGSAALDLAYVACGRFDAYFEYSLNAWDIAGGAIIVQEAGGRVCDFEGGDNYLFGGEIIAGGTQLMPAMEQLIQQHFYPSQP